MAYLRPLFKVLLKFKRGRICERAGECPFCPTPNPNEAFSYMQIICALLHRVCVRLLYFILLHTESKNTCIQLAVMYLYTEAFCLAPYRNERVMVQIASMKLLRKL